MAAVLQSLPLGFLLAFFLVGLFEYIPKAVAHQHLHETASGGAESAFPIVMLIITATCTILSATLFNRPPFFDLKEANRNSYGDDVEDADQGAPARQKALYSAFIISNFTSLLLALFSLVVASMCQLKGLYGLMGALEDLVVWLMSSSIAAFALAAAMGTSAMVTRDNLIWLVSGIYVIVAAAGVYLFKLIEDKRAGHFLVVHG